MAKEQFIKSGKGVWWKKVGSMYIRKDKDREFEENIEFVKQSKQKDVELLTKKSK